MQCGNHGGDGDGDGDDGGTHSWIAIVPAQKSARKLYSFFSVAVAVLLALSTLNWLNLVEYSHAISTMHISLSLSAYPPIALCTHTDPRSVKFYLNIIGKQPWLVHGTEKMKKPTRTKIENSVFGGSNWALRCGVLVQMQFRSVQSLFVGHIWKHVWIGSDDIVCSAKTVTSSTYCWQPTDRLTWPTLWVRSAARAQTRHSIEQHRVYFFRMRNPFFVSTWAAKWMKWSTVSDVEKCVSKEFRRLRAVKKWWVEKRRRLSLIGH